MERVLASESLGGEMFERLFELEGARYQGRKVVEGAIKLHG